MHVCFGLKGFLWCFITQVFIILNPALVLDSFALDPFVSSVPKRGLDEIQKLLNNSGTNGLIAKRSYKKVVQV